MTEPALQPAHESSRLSRVRHWLSRHPEAVAFWALALAHLIPVWAFHYLPTQDGPSHLANATIIKDHGTPGAAYGEFFEVRADPLPNWTSHLLLAALLYLAPPLVAEKLLVSLYVLGFAGAYRYFLGAFGDRCRPLSWAGLPFIYTRYFWMGFYNYCLCLVLLWVILGYCVRRRGTLHPIQVVVLTLLFTVEYFTHLAGFVLAVAGALGVAVLVPPRRVLAPALVVAAALPAACLAMDYFERTGFGHAPSAMRLVYQPLARLRGENIRPTLAEELVAVDDEVFAYHAGQGIPWSLVAVAYLGLLGALMAAERRWGVPAEGGGPGWLFPAVFGLLLLGIYLLVPDHLGLEHGGFLKTRLAPLPFLVWLACFREPALREARLLVRAVTVLLVAGNLLLVTAAVAAGNEEVRQYTAGVEAVGRDHRLFVAQADRPRSPLVDPLLHAADYYCLGTGNVNLDNYEASTPHFPVKYRRGVPRGGGSWMAHPGKDAVDVVLCWQPPVGTGSAAPAGWDEIFSQGPLHIYRRPPAR
jgi:hypothetical protein